MSANFGVCLNCYCFYSENTQRKFAGKFYLKDFFGSTFQIFHELPYKSETLLSILEVDNICYDPLCNVREKNGKSEE